MAMRLIEIQATLVQGSALPPPNGRSMAVDTRKEDHHDACLWVLLAGRVHQDKVVAFDESCDEAAVPIELLPNACEGSIKEASLFVKVADGANEKTFLDHDRVR